MDSKEYKRQWYLKNRERLLAKQAKYYEDHKEERLEYMAKRRLENGDEIREWQRQDRINNPEKYAEQERIRYARDTADRKARARRYKVKKRSSVCECCTSQEFKEIYEFAHLVGMHVDHIKPVSKGGAHCALNLQLLPPKVNLSKGANFDII